MMLVALSHSSSFRLKGEPGPALPRDRVWVEVLTSPIAVLLRAGEHLLRSRGAEAQRRVLVGPAADDVQAMASRGAAQGDDLLISRGELAGRQVGVEAAVGDRAAAAESRPARPSWWIASRCCRSHGRGWCCCRRW